MAQPLVKMQLTTAFDRRKVVRRMDAQTKRATKGALAWARRVLKQRMSVKQTTQKVTTPTGGEFVVVKGSKPGEYPRRRGKGVGAGRGAGALANLVRWAYDDSRQLGVVGPILWASTAKKKYHGAKTGAEVLQKGGTIETHKKTDDGNVVFFSRIAPRPFIDLIRPEAGQIFLRNMAQ